MTVVSSTSLLNLSSTTSTIMEGSQTTLTTLFRRIEDSFPEKLGPDGWYLLTVNPPLFPHTCIQKLTLNCTLGLFSSSLREAPGHCRPIQVPHRQTRLLHTDTTQTAVEEVARRSSERVDADWHTPCHHCFRCSGGGGEGGRCRLDKHHVSPPLSTTPPNATGIHNI